MISIYVNGSTVRSTKSDELTAGAVGIPVQFFFDGAWDGLEKMGYARVEGSVYPIVLNADNLGTLPWEALQKGKSLEIGVDGTSDTRRIPTIWCRVGLVLPSVAGVTPEKLTPPPTPWQTDMLESLYQEVSDKATEIVEQTVEAEASRYVDQAKTEAGHAQDSAEEAKEYSDNASQYSQNAKDSESKATKAAQEASDAVAGA